jgi:ribosomal protein S18 acetylase RimI-like enzyme
MDTDADAVPVCNIRSCTQNDVEAVVHLVERYWAFEGLAGFRAEVVRSLLSRLLRQPQLGVVLVASRNEEAVGYLLLVYVFSLEHSGLTAEIDELFVDERARSLGVGSLLLSEAERKASRSGCTNISLQISVTNDQAAAMYGRIGYRQRGYRLLEKDLPAPTQGPDGG